MGLTARVWLRAAWLRAAWKFMVRARSTLPKDRAKFPRAKLPRSKLPISLILVGALPLAASALAAAPAAAVPNYQVYEDVCAKLGEPAFCTGATPMAGPLGLAVDNSSQVLDLAKGDVYVASQGEPATVSRFEATGAAANFPAGTNIDENQLKVAGFQPIKAVAVEYATGDFYIANGVTSEVEEFNSDGIHELSFPIPLGTSVFGIAVDNSTDALDPDKGDVYVVNVSGNVVYRYTSTGTPAGEVTGATEGHPLSLPYTIAVDNSGDLYVVDPGSNVEKFNPTGEWVETLAEGESPNAVAVDPATGDVLVESNNGLILPYTEAGALLHAFNAEGIPPGGIYGVTAGAESRVYATAVGEGKGVIYEAGEETAPPSEVEVTSASGVTGVSATLNGRVNPGNFAEYHFKYCEGKGTCGETAKTIIKGDTQQAVSAVVKSLTPDTEYSITLVAENKLDGGTPVEAKGSFETLVELPEARTEPANTVTATSAELDGEINPGGSSTTYYFEYGTAPCSDGACAATAEGTPVTGNGLARRVVEAVEVTSLIPETTYHYELVATNSRGTIVGEEKEFTTAEPEPPPPPRSGGSTVVVKEIVKEVVKEGAPKQSISIVSAKVQGNSLVVTVNASSQGSVKISGPGVKTTSQAVAAGEHQIRVSLNKQGKADRKHHKTIKITVTLSAESASGSENVKF
jgi:hypothetical protein